MRQSIIKVVDVEITVNPKLREMFARIHADDSGKDAASPQFPRSEQCTMFMNAQNVGWCQTEDNLLELIHYLTDNGVKVADIAGPIKTFSRRTKKFALRLNAAANRERRRLEAEQEAARRLEASRKISFKPAPAFA